MDFKRNDVLVCFLVCLTTASAFLDSPVVHTRFGKVKGISDVSRSGRKFFAFKGIPYAKPPLGILRFQSPQHPDPWDGIRDAQNDADACIQKNYLFGNTDVEGSEDCLYINVYSPRIRVQRAAHLLPVMVFIHWGGFFTGYSSSKYLGPEYFMDKNVVLVTFNYRLGALGFLSTGDDASPGNYGLKDQVAALKWVQENIEGFGGDRKKVTLFGQSAGGASVHFHMLNPSSKGLFHQGISESGTALALWAKPLSKAQSLGIAQGQGTLVGCPYTNDTFQLVDCLRDVDAEEIIRSGDQFKYFSIDPLTVYLPAIEKKTEKNPEPFLTQEPIEYIQKGEFHRVPWILGTVSDEGIIRAAPLLSQSETRKKLNVQFNKLMPNLMALLISTPKDEIQIVWKKIKDYYFDGKNSVDITNAESIQGLVNLYTDRSFAYTLFQTALLHSIKDHDPIWLYNFKYKGAYSYGELFAATKENIDYKWGVSHCDELLYLFKSPAIFPELTNNNDVNMSKKLIELWTNFAIYGNPTPSKNLSTEENWLKIGSNFQRSQMSKNMNFFNITGSCDDPESVKMFTDNGFYENRFKFWEELPLVENIDDLHQRHVEL